MKGLYCLIRVLCLATFMLVPVLVKAQNPGGVIGHRLWLRPNDAAPATGGTLTAWPDQSGQNTWTITGTPTVNVNTINFNNSVSFNNNGSSGSLPDNYLAGNTTIGYADAFAVYKFDDPLGQSNFLGSVDNPAGGAYTKGVIIFGGTSKGTSWVRTGRASSNAEEFHINNISFDNTTYNIVNLDASLSSSPYGTGRVNGMGQTVVGNAPDFAFINFKPLIGGTNNNGNLHFGHMKGNGQLVELVVYPVTQNEIDKEKIESYFAIKYGITLASTTTSFAYLSSIGTVIYPASTTYRFDIFGIGKDDNSGLNQTQSNSINTGSGDGTGQSGKGNILLKTPSSLDNGDFLMIGHNNAPLTETMADLPAGLIKARLQREWKVKRTGTNPGVGTVSMEFDFNGLSITGTTSSSLSDFILLIDEDGDGDFTTGTVTQVTPNSFGSSKIIFDNLTLPDGAVFTFVTSPGFPLPLSLLSFTAGSSNCVSNVQWKTANEVNVSRYELQVSFDNSNWSTVHTTAANNSNDVNNYAYSYNHSTRSGNKLLRLKMIDQDGKTTYSKVISVQCGKDNLFNLYPNPASTQVTLTGTKAGEQLHVISIEGRMLQQHTATEGNSTIGIEALPSGTYLIRVLRNSQWTEAGRFVKQ